MIARSLVIMSVLCAAVKAFTPSGVVRRGKLLSQLVFGFLTVK
jgi:hypothetical protein